MQLLHFSSAPLSKGQLIVGLKATRKRTLRVGQRQADEVFEAIRKAEFPQAPPLFTALCLSDAYDPSIPRKAFRDKPSFMFGFLYEVQPRGKVYQVEPYWELQACQAVTKSGLRGHASRVFLEDMARKFWKPELRETPLHFYLCEDGAIILREVRKVSRQDVLLLP